MDDRRFLRDLARTAREDEAEEQRRWERWERLNDGALSAEEEAELNALAATSVEAKQALEAFRLLDSDFRARMVATIGPLLKATAAPAEVPEPAEEPVREKQPPAVQKDKPDPWFLFPWWRAGFLASGLATAVAAWFFFVRLPPLPAYSIAEVESGVVITRSGEQEPEERPALVAGAAFTANARPAAKVSRRATIEPRCYIELPRRIEPMIRITDCAASDRFPNGSMKIRGSLPENLPTGPATLWIVLAYPGDQPAADEIGKQPADLPTGGGNWDAEPTLIEVRAP